MGKARATSNRLGERIGYLINRSTGMTHIAWANSPDGIKSRWWHPVCGARALDDVRVVDPGGKIYACRKCTNYAEHEGQEF